MTAPYADGWHKLGMYIQVYTENNIVVKARRKGNNGKFSDIDLVERKYNADVSVIGRIKLTNLHNRFRTGGVREANLKPQIAYPTSQTTTGPIKLVEKPKKNSKKCMKYFDKEDVISWYNCENAKEYLETEGYFADYYDPKIDNIFCWSRGVLTAIHTLNAVNKIFSKDNSSDHGLFIPLSKIKEKVQYRPIRTIDEFKAVTGVGILSYIAFRKKGENGNKLWMIQGFELDGDEIKSVCIDTSYTMEDLFNDYEFLDKDEWKSFEVEE